ncbi:hypothetical protein [Paenibacillus sp. Leaf72]|uniref:hypothetical protein n=1 Tax=Paenibacillus sp. Leaf72 TaxID=1736234 RepID=UPI000A562037|nr:hypothetical protein [Paenibacillus sp. Leaf72]
MMKLDLGCGASKHPDFYGIDCRPLDGVDLVWDVNNGIPLPDNSIEWVLASRSLPYVQDLHAVLKEIYRISIHKSVVCILAPYAHSFRNATNPLLRHRFDEHTPRYLTKHFYQPPHGPESPEIKFYNDLEEIPFDFRLLRMEYFYNEIFRSPMYESEELEELQRLQANVVDEIMYHFVVVKEHISASELDQLSRQSQMEPFCVNALRKLEPPADPIEKAEPRFPEETDAVPPIPPKRSLARRHLHKKAPRFSGNPRKRSRYYR